MKTSFSSFCMWIGKRTVATFILTVICLAAFGQAQPDQAVISNLNVVHNAESKQILVSYDLAKGQQEHAIALTLYGENNTVLPAEYYQVSGDAGNGIAPGKKEVRISYTDQLAAQKQLTVQLTGDHENTKNKALIAGACKRQNIDRDIKKYARRRYFKTDKRALKRIKKSIKKEFEKNGLTVETQLFEYEGYSAHNLIGILEGKTKPEEIVIVGAHFDATEESRGADDNATGVAGMLEMMRVLSDYEFDHTIYFVAFDLEEEGFLGSQKFIELMENKPDLKIKAMVNLDMIGFKSEKYRSQAFPGALKNIFPDAYAKISEGGFRGDFILNLTNANSLPVAKAFQRNAALVPALKVITLNVPGDGKFAPTAFRASDHATFWDARLKAISIGDTGDARNFHYYTGNDRISTIDSEFAWQVVKVAAATVADLADQAKPHAEKQLLISAEASR